VTHDHETIEELLAGYALRSLSGPHAEEADRLLGEHVPGCDGCRATLDAFDRVAADLALGTAPIAPPETLLPRMRRELRRADQRAGVRWSPARLAAVAASLVVVVGIGGAALTRGTDTTVTTLAATNDIQQALALAERPDAETTQVGPMTEVAVPGDEEIYVYGEGIATPPAGSVYRLWAVSQSEPAAYLGDFLPTLDGRVVLRVRVDRTRYDGLLVTEEPAGSEPSTPGEPAWDAAA